MGISSQDIFRKILQLNDSNLISELTDACTSLYLSEGDFLIREGDYPTIVPFLIKGDNRLFCYSIRNPCDGIC